MLTLYSIAKDAAIPALTWEYFPRYAEFGIPKVSIRVVWSDNTAPHHPLTQNDIRKASKEEYM
jgi:hypothetical protein